MLFKFLMRWPELQIQRHTRAKHQNEKKKKNGEESGRKRKRNGKTVVNLCCEY